MSKFRKQQLTIVLIILASGSIFGLLTLPEKEPVFPFGFRIESTMEIVNKPEISSGVSRGVFDIKVRTHGHFEERTFIPKKVSYERGVFPGFEFEIIGDKFDKEGKVTSFISESDAKLINGEFYELDHDNSFTIKIELTPKNSGTYGIRLVAITYKESDGNLKRFVLPKDVQYRTGIINL